MRCTSVVIADRHPVVLQGLNSLLAAQPDFRVVASCGNGASCIDAIRMFTPDIAVLDIAMPAISGLEVLAIASCEKLASRLVFFTASVEGCDLTMLAAAGAYSVILKDEEPEFLVQILRQVADGRRLLPTPSCVEAVSRAQT